MSSADRPVPVGPATVGPVAIGPSVVGPAGDGTGSDRKEADGPVAPDTGSTPDTTGMFEKLRWERGVPGAFPGKGAFPAKAAAGDGAEVVDAGAVGEKAPVDGEVSVVGKAAADEAGAGAVSGEPLDDQALVAARA